MGNILDRIANRIGMMVAGGPIQARLHCCIVTDATRSREVALSTRRGPRL